MQTGAPDATQRFPATLNPATQSNGNLATGEVGSAGPPLASVSVPTVFHVKWAQTSKAALFSFFLKVPFFFFFKSPSFLLWIPRITTEYQVWGAKLIH